MRSLRSLRLKLFFVSLRTLRGLRGKRSSLLVAAKGCAKRLRGKNLPLKKPNVCATPLLIAPFLVNPNSHRFEPD